MDANYPPSVSVTAVALPKMMSTGHGHARLDPRKRL